MKFHVHNKLSGHFKLEVVDSLTGKTRQTVEFDNLIVNGGLDMIAVGTPTSGGIVYYGCVVGTGTTPPAPTNTSLQTFLAGTKTITVAASESNPGSPTYATTTTATWQFAAGVATGNLTEIGMCNTGAGQSTATVPTNASPLFSRALILVGGVPGTITVLAADILNVTYSITNFPIVTPATGSFTLNTDGTNTTVNYSILAANAISTKYAMPPLISAPFFGYTNNPTNSDTAYPASSVLGLPNGTPTGSGSTASGGTVTHDAYIAGTFFLSMTATCAPTGMNPAGGSIGCILIGASSVAPIQVSFSPAIAKTNLQSFQYVWNISWSN